MLIYRMDREEVYEACKKYLLKKGYRAVEMKDLDIDIKDYLYTIDMPLKEDKEK